MRDVAFRRNPRKNVVYIKNILVSRLIYKISILNLAIDVLTSLINLSLLHHKLFLKHLVLHLLFQELRFQNIIVLVADVSLCKIMLKILKLIVSWPLLIACSLGHLKQRQPVFVHTWVNFSQGIINEVIVVKEGKPLDPVESCKILALLHQLKSLLRLKWSISVIALRPVDLNLILRGIFPDKSVISKRPRELIMRSCRPWILSQRDLVRLLLLDKIENVVELFVVLIESISDLLGICQ